MPGRTEIGFVLDQERVAEAVLPGDIGQHGTHVSLALNVANGTDIFLNHAKHMKSRQKQRPQRICPEHAPPPARAQLDNENVLG